MSEAVPSPASGAVGPLAVAPDFTCSWSRQSDAVWVRVTGELDIATVPTLERDLREAELHARLVVIDLRQLAFMDCSGVHALVSASARAGRVGRRLILVRGPAQIDRVLALSGVSAALEIADPDAARRVMQAHQQLAQRHPA